MAATFEQRQARSAEQMEIGAALAQAAFDRGDRLTYDDRQVLAAWSRWGSDSYPVQRLGRGWTIDHRIAAGAGIFRTKTAAVDAWEILICKLIRLKGLESQQRAIADVNQRDRARSAQGDGL